MEGHHRRAGGGDRPARGRDRHPRGHLSQAHLMPLWVVLVLAYLFEFANGWTDAPNSIATVVSTRVMRPHHAVIMAGFLNLMGALTGTAVAKTIASGIV